MAAAKKKIAADHLLLGHHGEIQPGDEVPDTYRDSLGNEQKTDFERLAELDLLEK